MPNTRVINTLVDEELIKTEFNVRNVKILIFGFVPKIKYPNHLKLIFFLIIFGT